MAPVLLLAALLAQPSAPRAATDPALASVVHGGRVAGPDVVQGTPDLPAADGDAARLERRLVALGTWLELEVVAPSRPAALAASEAAVRAIEAVGATLSTWTSDSELARLNAAPVGEPCAVTPRLAGWLTRTRGWCAATGGAFDPTVGALVERWGLRDGGVEVAPNTAELEAARAGVGVAHWAIAEEFVTRLHPTTRFEEGAFGKGAALEEALAALVEAGASEARVDLGGQVAFLGRPARVDVAHPDDRALVVATLAAGAGTQARNGGSFATTGNSERGILVAGERRGHVLDPRTGAPADDWGALTVWCSAALDADALSTGLYVLGPAAAVAWADAHEGVEALALERAPAGAADLRLRAYVSRGFLGQIRETDHLTLAAETSGIHTR